MHSEQVEKFVVGNKFFITSDNLQSRCVDGRPAISEVSEKLPGISKPGADVGDLMIIFGSLNLLNLKIDPQTVLEILVNTNGGAQNFKFHTDSHAEEKQVGPGLGCGHINKALAEPFDYNLTAEQTDFIKSILPNLLEKGAKQVVLDGGHEEQAVLVIDSKNYGVKPYNEESQAFIYQQTLHQQQLDRLAKPLAEYLNSVNQPVEVAELRNTIDKIFAIQLGATLSRIAKGLPIYHVKIDEAGAIKVSDFNA